MRETTMDKRYRYRVVSVTGEVPAQVRDIEGKPDAYLVYPEYRGAESYQAFFTDERGIIGGWTMEYVDGPAPSAPATVEWCNHECPDTEPGTLRCSRLTHKLSDGTPYGTHMGTDADGRTYRWSEQPGTIFEVRSERKNRQRSRTRA